MSIAIEILLITIMTNKSTMANICYLITFDLKNTLHYGEFYALPIITQVKILHYPILAN